MTATSNEFASAHEAWHRGVEASRTAPHGPLSPTAMHWLTGTPTALEEAPGRWSADASGVVVVELSADDGVTRDGVPLAGTVTFEALTGTDGFVLEWGERRLELAARSGSIILRPRDPQAPLRLGYGGTATFAPDERWRVRARFEPVEREAVEIESAAGPGRLQHYDSPGRAVFELDGHEYALTLFGSVVDGDLRAVFADASGADLTYPAARSLGVTLIDEHTVLLDFNRAQNFPCAYTMHATCPFPPPENRLPLRIEAGELRPGLARP